MIKNLLKKAARLAVLANLALALAVPLGASAVNLNTYLNASEFNIDINKQDDLKGTVAKIINIILGFLGIVAVIIILAGGFKWMTAAGNEDKVGEARKMIIQGVIGLVVIFAAWGIASFAISQLINATNGTAR